MKKTRRRGEKTSRSRFTRHERNGNDIIRFFFFFFSFAWQKRSRIVDIFLVFEFQLSLFSCRGLLRSKGWTTRKRVLISRVNLLLRLRPENSTGRQNNRTYAKTASDCGTRRIIVPTFVFLHAAKRYPRLLLPPLPPGCSSFGYNMPMIAGKRWQFHDFSNEKDTKISSEISLSTLDSKKNFSLDIVESYRENL